MSSLGICTLVVGGVLLICGTSSADDRLLSDDTFDYRSTSDVVIDGGLVVGFPIALPTGLAKGLTAGITRGHRFAFGARAAWLTASEDSDAWAVTHHELHVRATAAVMHDVGRGTVGARLGLGGALVYEDRLRHQGMRAALEGDALETTAFALLPVATLEGVVALHIKGPWLVQLSGGPALSIVDGGAHGSRLAEVGLAWQP